MYNDKWFKGLSADWGSSAVDYASFGTCLIWTNLISTTPLTPSVK